MLAMLLIWPVYLGIKTSFTHDVLSEFATYGAGLENYKNLIKQQFLVTEKLVVNFAKLLLKSIKIQS